MNKQNILNKAQRRRAAKKAYKIERKIIPNADHWNCVTLILLLLSAFWHLRSVAGWLNGNTLVQVYGVDQVLATAIAKCPDILFYATYFAMALSVAAFVLTVVMLVLFLHDEKDAHDALFIVLLSTIICVWAFPVIHAITDLAATGMDIRDTTGFDVFQLGIDLLPMVITTAVALAFLWFNKRVNILT